MKALILKELKERKVVILVGLGFAIMPLLLFLVTRTSSFWMLRELCHPAAALVIVILVTSFPIMLAESTVAGEIEHHTLSFLLSLPVSRQTIWCAKMVSLLIAQCGVALFFMIASIPVFNLPGEVASHPEGFSYYLVALFLIPMVILSFSLLASTVTSKSMTASISSLLLIIILSLGFLYLLSTLDWSISLQEIILLCAVSALVPAGLSFLLFAKASFLDMARKIPLFLGYSAGALVVLALLVGAVYISPGCLLPLKYVGFGTFSSGMGGTELLAGVECQGISDYRMWLFDLSKGGSTRIKTRRVLAPLLVSENRVLYDKVKAIQVLMGHKVTMEHWVQDLSTMKKKLLADSTVNWASMEDYYMKGSYPNQGRGGFYFVLPQVEQGSVQLDVKFLSEEGAGLCSLRLPLVIAGDVPCSKGEPDARSQVSSLGQCRKLDAMVVSRGGKDYLHLLVPHTDSRGGDLSLVHYEIDCQAGKVHEREKRELDRGNSVSAFALSHDGTQWAMIVNEGNGKSSLILYDSKHRAKVLLHKDSLFLRNLCWLPAGAPGGVEKIALLDDQPSGSTDLVTLDPLSGHKEIVYRATSLVRFSPSADGRKCAILSSSGENPKGPCELSVLGFGDSKNEVVKGISVDKHSPWKILWTGPDSFILSKDHWELYHVSWRPEEKGFVRLYPPKEEK